MKTVVELLVGIPVGVWGCGTLFWMYAIVKNDRQVRQDVHSGRLDSFFCCFLTAALWPLVLVEMTPLLVQKTASPKADMHPAASVENAKESDKAGAFAT